MLIPITKLIKDSILCPQTLEDSTSRRLLFAWAGSSEITYPSDDYMWAHCLTLPRELTLEDNILKQNQFQN